MKYTSLIVIVFLWFSCKNNTPASTAKQEEKKIDSIAQVKNDTNIYRLVIMFYSIGEGSEYKFIKAFEDTLRNYSAGIGKTINYNKMPWGREGETDIISRLDDLTPSEQADFINKTKALLKNAKWVNIYENYLYRYHHR
jgi:hypothetical protein